MSVDKVGVYFRETEPDKKSATGLNAVSCKKNVKNWWDLKKCIYILYIYYTDGYIFLFLKMCNGENISNLELVLLTYLIGSIKVDIMNFSYGYL